MSRKSFLLMALVLMTWGSLLTPAESATPKNMEIPLRDFFRNPEETGHQISPDGMRLALLKPFENRMNLFVRDLKEGGLDQRLTEIKDRDISGFFWKGNNHLVFTRDFGGDENFHVFSVDIKSKAIKDLTPFEKTRATILNDLEDISANEILVQHNHRDPKVFDVYRINLMTGQSRLVAQNPGQITDWTTDHRGQVRVALESDGLQTHVLYRDSENQKFRKLFSFGYKESFSPALFTPDNKNIYALSNLNRDKVSLVEFNPQSNKEVRIIYQHPEVDVEDIYYSKKRKVLTGVRFTTWKMESTFFDQEIEKIFNRILSLAPREEIRSLTHDKKEEKYIVRTYSDRSLGSIYFYDSKKDELKKITTLAPWLPEEKMAEIKPIHYKTRDGLLVNGYLTLPLGGGEGKKWPLVVNPHGGPWARDRWGFNPTAQFLANRGFAVFQMNFRGSTGYGKKFFEASFKQWGRKMLDDVTDGVQWLISQGQVDKKRICIFGGSYGGYKTLAALAFTPELYACGVDYVGVSNLFTFMKTIPPYWTTELDKLYEMVGHPEKDKELLTATSPALHADKIKAPLFVAQGAKDPRVNKAESDQMVEALRKRGVEVPYLVKEDEGHGFRNEENRFEFYEAMEKFLRKHIGN